MVYKKKKGFIKKRTVKKRIYKKKKAYAITRNISLPASGMPKMIKMNFKYSGLVVNAAAVATPYTHFVSCNGLFDPDITAAGHQPLYFDQMMAFYNHYTVIGAKITASFQPTAVDEGFMYGILVTDDTTYSGSNTLVNMSEQPSGKFGITAYNATGRNRKTLTWSAKKNWGGDILDNDELKGTVAGNPVEQQYFMLYFAPIDQVSTVNCNLHFIVEYIAVLRERKDMATS